MEELGEGHPESTESVTVKLVTYSRGHQHLKLAPERVRNHPSDPFISEDAVSSAMPMP